MYEFYKTYQRCWRRLRKKWYNKMLEIRPQLADATTEQQKIAGCEPGACGPGNLAQTVRRHFD
jgi:hypothetical protein